MSDPPAPTSSPRGDPQESYTQWARAVLLSICERLIESDAVGQDAYAQVAWTVPNECLIARVSCPTRAGRDLWATGGNLPVDSILLEVAGGPRDAARHFSLRWQLESARLEGLGGADAKQGGAWMASAKSLADQAERLNRYVRDDAFWGAANVPQPAA